MAESSPIILLTGASGYVGGRLLAGLRQRPKYCSRTALSAASRRQTRRWLSPSATRSKDSNILGLKFVNVWGGPMTTKIVWAGLPKVKSVKAIAMASPLLKGINTPDQPGTIAPKSATIVSSVGDDWNVTLEPMSFTIITAELE